jgi:hypothetical protein
MDFHGLNSIRLDSCLKFPIRGFSDIRGTSLHDIIILESSYYKQLTQTKFVFERLFTRFTASRPGQILLRWNTLTRSIVGFTANKKEPIKNSLPAIKLVFELRNKTLPATKQKAAPKSTRIRNA